MKNALIIISLLISVNSFAQNFNPEFGFDKSKYCTNEGVISPIHLNGGVDGIYTYENESNSFLSLNEMTGEIDLSLSEPGIYIIKNEISTDEITMDFTQEIEIINDNTPPVIMLEDFYITVNPGSCKGDFTMPDPEITDDSDAEIQFAIEGPEDCYILAPNTTENPTAYYQIYGLAAGEHNFIFSATDACGNEAHKIVAVSVVPSIVPIDIWQQNINVSLYSNDYDTKVYAKNIVGNNSNCNKVKHEIRRLDDACNRVGNTTFNDDGDEGDGSNDILAPDYDFDDGRYITVCLADIDSIDANGEAFGIVPYVLREWVDFNNSGIMGDSIDINNDGDFHDIAEFDSYQQAIGYLEVRKHDLFGLITCPSDVTINCDDDPTDIGLTGSTVVADSIDAEEIIRRYDFDFDSCNEGIIDVNFLIENDTICTQHLIIENPYPPFDPADIVFPSDTVYTNCENIDFAQPTWPSVNCLYATVTDSSTDTVVWNTNWDYTIERSFTFVDWCRYDQSDGIEGVYYGSQFITVIDEKPPTAICSENISVELSDLPITISADNFHMDVEDDCTDESDLRYTFSDVSPDLDMAFDTTTRASTKELTLADIDNGQLSVDVYYWDLAGNYSFCTVVLQITTGTEDLDEGIIQLSDNFPNPFHKSTTLEFNLQESAEVKIIVYDISGKKHFCELDYYTTGQHKKNINLTDAPSGILFYNLILGNAIQTGKLLKL